MSLFGVGAGEAALVLVLAMIVVGPQRFPEIARQGGRWYRLARQYTDEVMKDVRSAVDDIEQEINSETEDLKSLGSLGDDLRGIRDDVESIGAESASDAERTMSDTATAAGSDSASSNGATESTAKRDTSVRPSRRTEDS
jgi:sec-independent protein translocase protein TatB